MKEDWEKAIAFVLKMEGGYTNDPVDKGGETNYGISKRSYPNLDIKNLTVEAAREIYHSDFWLACSCDDLPTPFAISVFDAAVNQGTTPAKRMLQMALGVEVDGVIGPKTLAAAAQVDSYRIKKYLAERLVRYQNTIVKDNSQQKFAMDWFYRVISLAEIVLAPKVAPVA